MNIERSVLPQASLLAAMARQGDQHPSLMELILPEAPLSQADDIRLASYRDGRLHVFPRPPHELDMLLLAGRIFKRDGQTTLAAVAAKVGPVTWDEYQLVRFAAGLPPAKSRESQAPIEIADFIDLFAARQRDDVAAILRAPGRGEVRMQHIARAAALPPPLQMLACWELVRIVAEQRSPASALRALSYLETIAEGQARSEWPLIEVLRDLAAHDAATGSLAGYRAVKAFSDVLGANRRWIAANFCDGAPAIFAHLPSTDLKDPLFREARKKLNNRASETPNERSPVVAHELANDLIIEKCLENRTELCRIIMQACLAQIEIWREDPEANIVEAIVPVLDDTGAQIGDAQQKVTFELSSCGDALRRLKSGTKSDRRKAWQQSKKEDARSWTLSDLPEDVLVIYRGISPLEPGGPTAEPFFVNWYRWGVLEPSIAHPALIGAMRVELVKAAGHRPYWQSLDGFFVAPEPLRHVYRAIRGHDPDSGEIAIPVFALYHGMLAALLARQLTQDTACRALELLQARLGSDGIQTRVISGETRYVLRLRPKGSEPLRDYPVDPATLGTLKQVAAFSAQRWFAPLQSVPSRIRLPVRHLCAAQRTFELPEAEYVFQNHSRTAKNDEFNMLLKLATWNVSCALVHDRRYVVGTQLGLADVTRDTRARFLSHSPQGNHPEQYDLGPSLTAVGRAKSAANRRRKRRS